MMTGKRIDTVIGPVKMLPECKSQAVCVNGSKCWEAGRCLRQQPDTEQHARKCAVSMTAAALEAIGSPLDNDLAGDVANVAIDTYLSIVSVAGERDARAERARIIGLLRENERTVDEGAVETIVALIERGA